MWKNKQFKFESVTELKATLVKLPETERRCTCGNMLVNRCKPPRKTIFAAIFGATISCAKCYKAYNIADMLKIAKSLNLIEAKNETKQSYI